MKNVREEVVNKGKVLVDLSYCGGELNGYRKVIDLIVAKMDNITDKDSDEYSVLNELLNDIWDKHNEVEKLEAVANEKLDQLIKS
ncbi:hypothetical protein [Staphylococcus saprophyticus]|uniref:hypothetical protein n=1 Tax=Staphylococcus saprophyticus TaxID=29385 RepID=UPI001E559ADB|nr:hypothetical protein [Staphylococcus saprophyticus]MCD9064500.1 hypothetical protein [Staphylococcus saprophyticus]